MRSKLKKTINAGIVDRRWEYHPDCRLEGLLQASKFLKWKNVKSFDEISKEKQNDKN